MQQTHGRATIQHPVFLQNQVDDSPWQYEVNKHCQNVSALLVPICCPFPLLAMRCCSTPLLPSGAVRWQKQAVSLTHFSWPKMLAPSMCCRIVLEGERQSSGYGETHIERNSCATVIKL